MQNNYTLKLVKSTSYDPWYNLALEEHLFNKAEDNEIIFYLWQNDNTVVIGRNQNPWRECRYTELERDEGKLARRLSGGGAVYHDLGNMNFTFIMKESLYNVEKQLQVIINGVKKLGINAEFSGRNDILVEGKKFSGNAFYSDEGRCYHHGTLLVDSDISKLCQYLKVSKEKMESKGIKSVQARVINLKEINTSIDIKKLSEALEISFQEVYNSSISENAIMSGDTSEFKELYDKYSSWKWRYGETPNFQISFYNRFSWGDLDINLNLRDGEVMSIAIFSDAMDYKLIKDMEKSIQGIKFEKLEILQKLEMLNEIYDKNIISDIENWLNEKDI
ncbi:lipoate-protein ligase A [Clostridium homopropionicum DSM 5847]|uniref:lipoate--protein ligase n=1 Tax=Clostridium homopropionicum DSM 5847 TaxID=1121318 RepID=A0A0L6ZFF1_9CLOT|nr:lipoate--protein ligase [Clostridium homopropionicum]KOA21538.1 lipoate-protein ligase A [Clostridium homopropionicum DSM 5847]SFG06495.1 lipoate-protein ligase [Clostridium homopropionicum]